MLTTTVKKQSTMVAVKQEAQNMIQNLPDNCTYEDIQYHLYVVEKIKNGINRAENGEISSHQDTKSRMAIKLEWSEEALEDVVLFVAVVHGKRLLENHQQSITNHSIQ